MKLTEKKRKDIIDAAIGEFREQGFLGARMGHIATQAGVSSRTLYNHFESKEALFEAIMDILLAENAAFPVTHFDADQPLKPQLMTALQAYVRVLTGASYIGLCRLVVSEFLRDQALSGSFFARLAEQDSPMTIFISEAMDAKALKQADPGFASSQLLALVKNFFFWPDFLLGAPLEQDAGAVMEDCVDMFLQHYAPDSPLTAE